MKEKEFGKTEYFKEVSTHYHALYDDAVNKIRNLVDLNNGLKVKDSNKNKIRNKEQMEKFNEIAIKWNNLSDAKERLLFVNDLFTKYFDKSLKTDFFDTFEHSLADYSAVDLLNDFQHFESFHSDQVSVCECDIVQFVQSEREKEEKSNLASLSSEHRNILDIAIKAHQFMMHRTYIRPLRRQKNEKNKFVQEMVVESEEMENEKDENEQRMNDLMDELIKKGMKQSNAQKFMQFIEVHQWDSDAIKYDLEQRGMFNKMDQSNLFYALNKNKYFVKVIKNHFKIKGNDNDKITVFSFGPMITFKSWQYFKRSKYFVEPKHANLKEELLKNSICAMDINLFHRQLAKAHIFASSKKGKKIKAKDMGRDNTTFEVPPFCPISVAHILCALVYCNCTNVQYEFKKYGTRKNKDRQTFEELKQLNWEINRWYSLLFECVIFFGSETTEKDIFYTGLNIPLLFDSFAPTFTAPISTTVGLNIATNFSKGTGVILKMRQGKGQAAHYLNVEWLSDYSEERERLFFLVNTLRILDVQTWHNGKKFVNDEYIKAMTLFSSLFAGHYLLDLLNKKTQKLLCAFIRNFNLNNNIKSNGQIIKNQLSLFMEQCFFNLVHKMDKMIVINKNMKN